MPFTKQRMARNQEGTAYVLKAEEELPHILQSIIQEIRDSEEISAVWRKGVMVKTLKKGDLNGYNNWRVIKLLSLTSKVFSRVILQRITTTVDFILWQEQASYQKGWSCTDHIFVLQQILEQSREWNSPLYGLHQLWDGIWQPTLCLSVEDSLSPWHPKETKHHKSLYENIEYQVIYNNQLTEPFRVDTGVK